MQILFIISTLASFFVVLIREGIWKTRKTKTGLSIGVCPLLNAAGLDYLAGSIPMFSDQILHYPFFFSFSLPCLGNTVVACHMAKQQQLLHDCEEDAGDPLGELFSNHLHLGSRSLREHFISKA